jgi:hypothetical protein
MLGAAMATSYSDSLLYRYFFYDWLFKDVQKGKMFERAAAWRHNQEQARWLPVYMRRWLFLSTMFYAIGVMWENALGMPYPAAFFYVCMVGALSVNAVIGTSMLGLRYFPAPGGQS